MCLFGVVPSSIMLVSLLRGEKRYKLTMQKEKNKTCNKYFKKNKLVFYFTKNTNIVSFFKGRSENTNIVENEF